jgi:hypothetical protein
MSQLGFVGVAAPSLPPSLSTASDASRSGGEEASTPPEDVDVDVGAGGGEAAGPASSGAP